MADSLFRGRLYPFQAKDAARAILRTNNIAVWDAGTGKSVLACAVICILLEDGVIDNAILCVEKNKLDSTEWPDEFVKHTNLRPNIYHGVKRKLDLANPVTITTYATLRDDMVRKHPADNRVLYPTEVMEAYDGRRILLVFDEAALFGSSMTSVTYRAFEMAIERWRSKSDTVRTLSMTATPLRRSPENHYNFVRLMCPQMVPSPREWSRLYVTGRDRFDRPNSFRDLDKFEESLRTIMLRKRKTDPDVIDQFPKLIEKFPHVQLGRDHLRAYRSLDAFTKDAPPADQVPSFRIINAFVCHPQSILFSQWKVAQEWITEYGYERIAKLSSIKARVLMHDVSSIIQAEGGGVIVFAHSVSALKALAVDMRSQYPGISFGQYHGGQSDAQNSADKAAFKAGDVSVLLCSSKAERGVNLPEAHHIRNFDVPTTHDSYIQRLNRGSRIGSNAGGTLLVKTYITDNTIEEATVRLWIRRNEWSDTMHDADVVDDENFTSALDRIKAIRLYEMEEA